jgi:hypothetical protein
MAGTMIQKQKTTPNMMFTSAHHGVMRGDPIQEI